MIEPSTSQHFHDAKPPSRYRLLGQRELLEQPRMSWLVQSVLPKAGIAAIYGDTKSGKSFLAIDLLLAVAEGRDWFGYQTEAVPATYLALEGQAGVTQRVLAYSVSRGEPNERFKVIAQDFSLTSPDDINELAACLTQSGRRDGVLIIDTLARAVAGLDENASRDMGQVIQAASRLQSLVGGLVVLVHHTGKDGNKGPRGHSSLIAALDAAIRVDQKGSRRIWNVDKAKDAEDGREHDFELEVVSLRKGEWDYEASSCVVIPMGAPRFSTTSDQMPRGEIQEFVWKAIKSEQERSHERGRGGAPEAMPCVHFTRLIELGREKLTKLDPHRVRERIKNATDSLLEKGVIKGDDGWYWLPKFPEIP